MTDPARPSGQPDSGQPAHDQPQYSQPQSGQPQSGQPQYGQPQYGQPQYSQPQYSQPQYGQPQYGQPQYGQPQYGQPQYGQPQQAWEPMPGQPPAGQAGWEQLPGSAPRPPSRRRGALAAAAAVVVVAGGGVTYAALRQQNSGGAASPQGAVKSIVADLGKSDLLGILGDLPPAERSALTESFTSQVKQLKRLQVLQPAADPGKVAGVQFASSGLTYEPNDEVVNNHVRIVKLTGGTVTVNSDAKRIPFTKQFLDAAFDGTPPTDSSTDVTDLSKNASPVRIAVQKVRGKWYPSVLYTMMDSIVHDDHLPQPTGADVIAPTGAGSADDAVRQSIVALADSDYDTVIGLLDPSEDAAVHDYGKVLTRKADSPSKPEFTLDDVTFTDTKVDGGVRVSFKSASITTDGEKVSATLDGDCLVLTKGNDSHRECAMEDLQKRAHLKLTAPQRAAVQHLIAAIPKIGVVATRSNGKWFVSPVRSYIDVGSSVLGGLQGNDLLVLIKLFKQQ